MIPPLPSTLELGPLSIKYYGVCITVGVVLGYYLVHKRSSLYGISKETIDNLLPYLIIAVLVGARLYHVIDDWSYYSQNQWQILAIWQGGIGIYGGLIAGLATALWFAKRYKIDFLRLLDLSAPSILLAQAIGRIGNYFNQEAFGPPTTLPWGVYIDEQNRPSIWQSAQAFHPLFLYDFLWNFIGFILLYRYAPRVRQLRGLIIGCYFIWFGFGRLLIEQLRFDTALLFGIKLATIISMVLIILGLILVSRTFVKSHIKT